MKKLPAVKNGLSTTEAQERLEKLIINRAEELKRLRRERHRAHASRKKQVAVEKAIRLLRRTFRECKECKLMVLQPLPLSVSREKKG